MFMVMSMARKTTVILRDDLYEMLKAREGAKGISKAINEILAEHLATSESMFGTMKKTTLKDLRNHRDHE